MNKVLLIIAMLATGCATTGALQSKSARLESESREFYSEVRDRQVANNDSPRVAVTRAAEALALSSRDLHRAVERRAASDRVMVEFDRVARDYKRLHDSLAADGYADQNRNVLAEFDNVTQAYLAVENSLGSRNAKIGQAVTSESGTAEERQAAAIAEVDRRARLKSFWFP